MVRSRRAAIAELLPLSLREGERARALLVAGYLFLVIAALVTLKSVRRALYLDDFGAENLPIVMIAIAVIVGLFVAGYIRLAGRVANGPLTAVSLAVFISHLALFWLVAREGARWLSPVLYVWVGCFAAIAPVQVWTLTNELFTTREVKRVVALIGSAGIVGAIAGGTATSLLASVLGTENLLLLAAGLLALAMALVATAGRVRRPVGQTPRAPDRPRNLRQAARLIAGSRHLAIIAGLVWIGAVATTTVEFQYSLAADSAGFTRDGLTGFFGAVLGSMSLAGLVIQLVAVRPLLQRAGVGTTILVLPMALFLGTAVLAFAGSLVVATLLKASDGAFKHSIDRSSRELAWLPVPGEIKVSVKSAIDMVLDRLGDGCSGLLMLVLATGLGFGLRAVSLVNLALIAVWIALALALRNSYRAQLGASIRGAQRLVPGAAEFDADAVRAIEAALSSGVRERVVAGLELARSAPPGSLTPVLRTLAADDDLDVRARALGLLLEPDGDGLPDEMTEEIGPEDRELLARTFDLVLAERPEQAREHAIALIGDATPTSRGAMVALLVRRLGPQFEPLVGPFLDSLTAPGLPSAVRCAGAAAIGLLPEDHADETRLAALIADDDRDVAVEAAESASRLGYVGQLPAIIALLDQRRRRADVRRALRRFGPAAGPALADALVARGGAGGSRHVARLLAETADTGALASLAPRLVDADPGVRGAVRACLAQRRRMRRHEPLPGRLAALSESALAADLAACDGLFRLWAGRGLPGRDARSRFLGTALVRTTTTRVGGLLEWLDLLHPPGEVDALRASLFARDARRRENALELLESLAPRPVRAPFVSLVEALAVERDRTLSERAPDPDGRLLDDLVRSGEPWLAACAAAVARASVAPGAPAADDPPGTPGGGGMSGQAALVERVMALKGVEIFARIEADELVHLASVAEERSYRAGERLFDEGDPPGGLLVLLDGDVALTRGDVSMGEIRAVAPIGAWSLFDDEPRAASAIALTDVRVIAIERDDFFDVLAEHVEILRGLVGHLVHRLRALAV